VRYDQLLAYVQEYAPSSILEVGTWNGHRAVQMLNIVPDAKYCGFDLFEDATEVTDAEEKNVKPHHTLASVRHLLSPFNAELHKGNTRETLPKLTGQFDFVWLDGGHSIETIESDWKWARICLAPGAMVLFDDYYTGPIDTEKFGCNKIVERHRHVVLPAADPVSGGGWVQMVRVWP